MPERLGNRKEEVAIPADGRDCFPSKHVAVGAGRKLLPQHDFRIAPGFSSHGDVLLRLELSEKTHCTHQKRGFAERANKCYQDLEYTAAGPQGQDTSLANQRAVDTTKPQ